MPAGGDEAARAGELDERRAGDPALRARLEPELGAGPDLGRADGDELDGALPVGVAVALGVRGVEALGEVRPERHGQLEGLAAVAQLGLARRRQLAGLGERADVGDDAVAALLADCEPERGEDAGELGHEHLRGAELLGERAGVQGSGAAEGDEREVARVVAALDRDEAQGAQQLGVDHLDDRLGLDPARAPARPRPDRGRARRGARRGAGRAAGWRR